MGLDSVELVFEIEKYFSIDIPDPEVEKVITVQQMVDCVAGYLKIVKVESPISRILFEQIRQFFELEKSIHLSDSMKDPIFCLVNPYDKDFWTKMSSCLNLSIPSPIIRTNKLLKLILWNPIYNWKEITVNEFISSTIAMNLSSFISKEKIGSKYEIYCVIKSITVDKIGVDYFDVEPNVKFVDDLGIN